MLKGKAEVIRRRQKLAALFDGIHSAELSPELTANYARYMCVLVCGYAEQSVVELATHFCRNAASPQVRRYAAGQLARLSNVNTERLKQVVEAFEPEWWVTLQDNYPDELEAFGSVVAVRNAIAHGDEQGITMDRVRDYFDGLSRVLLALADHFDPASAGV